MPTLHASGMYVHSLFVAACDKEKKHPKVETSHTMRQWGIDRAYVPTPNWAGPGMAIDYAAKTFQTEFVNYCLKFATKLGTMHRFKVCIIKQSARPK